MTKNRMKRICANCGNTFGEHQYCKPYNCPVAKKGKILFHLTQVFKEQKINETKNQDTKPTTL